MLKKVTEPAGESVWPGRWSRRKDRTIPDRHAPGLAAQEIARRRGAYEEIIRSHQAALLRAARRMCSGDEERAQDLVQEALVRSYEAFIEGRFQEGSNACAWLLRILTNGFINARRRQQRWEADLDVEALIEQGNAASTVRHDAVCDRPERALMAATLDEPLERALASLSDDLRVCVVLVDVEGMEYAEAAAAIDVPVGTIRSRLFRARQQLHARLFNYARDLRRV